MKNDKEPKENKRKLTRSDLIRLQKTQRWEEEASLYREEDQRALRGLQYQKEPIADSLRDIEQGISMMGQGRQSRLHRLPVRLALAATFLLAVVAGYFVIAHQQSGEQLFAQHFEYTAIGIDADGLERRASEQSISLLSSAVRAYETEGYKDAEGLFRSYLAQQPDDLEASFYYAVLQLGKGNAAVALPILEEVAARPPKDSYDRAAYWYLGLAHLKMNETEVARGYFLKLKDGKDRFAKNARGVLADM
jgi:TolA-binding protein